MSVAVHPKTGGTLICSSACYQPAPLQHGLTVPRGSPTACRPVDLVDLARRAPQTNGGQVPGQVYWSKFSKAEECRLGWAGPPGMWFARRITTR